MGIGLVVLGLGFVGFIVYRRRRFESADDIVYRTSDTPSVIIDDGYDWKGQPPLNHSDSSVPLNESSPPVTAADTAP